MGEICLGFAAAHSPILFVRPERWLEKVHEGPRSSREPESFKVTPANLEKTKEQVRRCLAAYSELKHLLEEAEPDALIIIGDDQGENFTHHLMPQFIVYTGATAHGSFSLGGRVPIAQQDDTRDIELKCDPALANELLATCLSAGVDLAFSRELPGTHGLGHAHVWPLRHLTPQLNLPIVPVFINTYFPPTATPARCYRFGRAIAEAVRKSAKRVAIFASGGLSHFPRHLSQWGIAPYPPEKRWYIDENFDRGLLEAMIEGNGSRLEDISSVEMDAAGNVESRNWVVLAGALENRKGRLLAYEPVYTVAIGMGFAAWE